MHFVYFILLLLAGVCFGLAAGRTDVRRVDLIATGLLLWVIVEIIQQGHRL